ncbi:hypothetical protein WR25_23232 [Diploscapter pachys]|uniref:G-protein coupled receptors family 1 profile domain-containing protein n=1 Tax=Diploscapter pachys TaxID=2018661 RepID=A0A2A2LAC3_9BILA|nr:hypothetical protein WR25_23232 [Diploscapter pachys]
MMHCGDPPLFDLTNNNTIRMFQMLIAFNEMYTIIHRHLCLFVCIFGAFLNFIHCIVLSRRSMRIYTINALLWQMAVFDALTMTSYAIYIMRFRLIDDENSIGYSYYWLIFLIGHVTASIALHTGSLYLSVIMAYIRWISLDRLDAKWMNHTAIRYIFVYTCLFLTLISIPTILVHQIVPVSEVFGTNDTQYAGLYTVQLDETDINGCKIFRLNLWITGIMFKGLPCGLLLLFTIALIIKLYEVSEKRRLLRGETSISCASANASDRNVLIGIDQQARRKKAISVDKTTSMLIIMLLIFLITELPQGLLAILSAIYPTHVQTFIYVYLGELLDLLSLINCLTSFTLYSLMSSTYRSTALSLFCRHRNTKKKKRTSQQTFNSLKLLLT